MASNPLSQLAWMALTAGLLYLFSAALPHAPCWGLFGLAALTAWPIWAYRTGNALFHRRLLIDGVALPQGRLRRWFWTGHLTQALGTLSALVLAALLLALTRLLDAAHWAVLALDVLLLSLVSGPMRRWLAGEVLADQAAPLARRWPLMALNLMLLAVGFSVVEFALGGADTRGLAWHQVAEAAFSTQSAACPAAGWLTGTMAAAQALTWHSSTLLIPSLPDQALKLVAWIILLARAGLLAWLFTNLLLGVGVLSERRDGAQGRHAGTISTAFIYTVLVLAVPYLYATLKLREFDPSTLAQPARALVDNFNPCRLDPASQSFGKQLDTSLQQTRDAAVADAEARIDDGLNALFAEVERGVDAYLDWYFTLIGEYERLAALTVGNFGVLMTEQLQRHLFDETGFSDGLTALTAGLDAARADHLRAVAETLDQQVAEISASNSCLSQALSEDIDPRVLTAANAGLQRDAIGASAAAGAGVAAGAVTAKLLAKKTGAAVAAKLAAKKSFQTAATVVGKVAAKKGGSVLLSALGGATLCAPSGPWALVCGIGAGAAAWFAVDKAVIEIDELRFRAEMRADLLAAVDEQRALLATTLKARQAAAVDARLFDLTRRFVPARDGF